MVSLCLNQDRFPTLCLHDKIWIVLHEAIDTEAMAGDIPVPPTDVRHSRQSHHHIILKTIDLFLCLIKALPNRVCDP